MSKITLHLDFLTHGLNGSEGLIRQHHFAAKAIKTRLTILLRSQMVPPFKKLNVPLRVTYIRYAAQLMDWDNAAASFKHIGDALQDAGIISDDSPKIIAQFIPRQEKVKKHEQRTEIIIETLR